MNHSNEQELFAQELDVNEDAASRTSTANIHSVNQFPAENNRNHEPSNFSLVYPNLTQPTQNRKTKNRKRNIRAVTPLNLPNLPEQSKHILPPESPNTLFR